MHGHHHGAEIIRLEHRLARFAFLDALVAAQQFETARKVVQLLAFLGIDHTDALERDIQSFGGLFDLRAVTQQDRDAEAQ